MKSLLLYLQNHQTRIASLVLFVISIAFVVYLTPREVKFKYEFQKGKPWLYENLVAPFDFPVIKTPEEIEAEKKRLDKEKTLFLKSKAGALETAYSGFEAEFNLAWDKAAALEDSIGRKRSEVIFNDPLKTRLENRSKNVLKSIYSRGVLQPFERQGLEYGEVLLTQDGVSTTVQLSDYYSIATATEAVRSVFKDEPEAIKKAVIPAVLDQLQYNVYKDQKTTDSYLQSQMESIVPTRGVVQDGELIIFKGNIVDDEKFAKLNSLKLSYQGSFDNTYGVYYLLGGQILQMGLLFAVLYIFLMQFRKQLMEDITKLTFILMNVLFVVLMVRLVLSFGVQYVYLVPFTILPITLKSFFDTRLALFVNMVAVLVCGIMLPNSFEFIYLQFIAGVFSVVLVNNLYKRSQLFFTAAKIILVYCLSYLAMAVIQEGNLEQIDKLNFAFFAGNGFLTLMSFPLIYFQEKTFGFVSDVSLLELSDTNNPLLRKLAQQAPGTFQHSMQVANLAEAAVLKIHGNALLVRTGALYHDIGKMNNPMYFIENQTTGLNPHDELSFEESAEIIIGHVKDGIKLAKKNNLPDVLIDFIRTHHGTSTVMYFYKKFIKNFPEEEVDLAKFTYPGPKPFSKETATLMMADSVEAASRSLPKPDHEKIDRLVENVIDQQMESGQFENADITLREIKEIKKIFKKMLMNIYHVRVQYPE
jgi:hypothetical protein